LIIDKFYILPIDAFVRVLILLKLENVLDEKLLKVFVGVVDAELWKI
jgi:hypothetical protein